VKLLGWLPRRAARWLGCWIGRVAFVLAGGLRRTGYHNLRLALPELAAQHRAILVGSFESLGRSLAECAYLPRVRTASDAARFMGVRGRQHLDAALARGRGVLFLTGHIGGWEIGPYCLRLLDTPPINFLVRRIDNPLVEAFADRLRTTHGNRTIDKAGAARPVLEALRRGEMVGILADLNTLEREGVFVDFFGVPASTTKGLAAFALRSDAVVVPGFTIWDPAEHRYVLELLEPVALVRSGSKQDDIVANTARFTAVLEAYIRRHPDQWLWIHKRWKTRPGVQAGDDG
jgi:KDO2-lipid IV(A) lauroyltransferase